MNIVHQVTTERESKCWRQDCRESISWDFNWGGSASWTAGWYWSNLTRWSKSASWINTR